MQKELATKIINDLADSEGGKYVRMQNLWNKFKDELPLRLDSLKKVTVILIAVKEKDCGKFSQDYKDALSLEFLIEKHYPEIKNKIKEICKLKKAANLHTGTMDGQIKIFNQDQLPPQHPAFPDDFDGDRYGGGGYDDWY